jgi:hypothetical protein
MGAIDDLNEIDRIIEQGPPPPATLVIGLLKCEPAMLLDPEAYQVTPANASRDHIDRMAHRRRVAEALADQRIKEIRRGHH